MPVIFEAQKKSKVKSQKSKVKKEGLDHLVRGHPLSAFLVKPLGVRFAAQEKKEEIILLLRRHPITNLPWIAFLALLLFVPLLLFPLLIFLKILPPNLPSSFKIIGSLFWYLGCFGFFLVNSLLWYFNVNLITNKRIIDLDFIYLLYQETTATRLTQVEDVTYKMGGIVRSIFNYGDIFVHTAGPEQNIEFLGVPKPAEVVKTIVELMGKKRRD